MVEKGILCGTLDCVEEVKKIHEVLGDEASKCRIVFRLWVDDSHASCPLGSKFGCKIEELDAILTALKEYNMNAVGVAFHVGSGNSSVSAYDGAIASAKVVFDKAKEYGFVMNLLDLGGGWAGFLGKNELNNPILDDAATVINNALEKYGFNEVKGLKIIAEPGRYFNERTISVGCTVTGVTKRNGRFIYRLNEGVKGVFKDKYLSEMPFETVPLKNDNTDLEKTYPSSLLGSSAFKDDTIVADIQLPEMKVGDHIMFTRMGAYTVSLSSLPQRSGEKQVYFIRKSSLSHSRLCWIHVFSLPHVARGSTLEMGTVP